MVPRRNVIAILMLLWVATLSGVASPAAADHTCCDDLPQSPKDWPAWAKEKVVLLIWHVQCIVAQALDEYCV